MCGSPSIGEKGGDTDYVSHETCVVIGSFSNVIETPTADAAGTNIRARSCLMCMSPLTMH